MDFLSSLKTFADNFTNKICRQNHGCEYHLTDFCWRNMAASSFCDERKSTWRLSKPAKSLWATKREKIVENNVKCGEIIIQMKFSFHGGDFVKESFSGAGEKFWGPEDSPVEGDGYEKFWGPEDSPVEGDGYRSRWTCLHQGGLICEAVNLIYCLNPNFWNTQPISTKHSFNRIREKLSSFGGKNKMTDLLPWQ